MSRSTRRSSLVTNTTEVRITRSKAAENQSTKVIKRTRIETRARPSIERPSSPSTSCDETSSSSSSGDHSRSRTSSKSGKRSSSRRTTNFYIYEHELQKPPLRRTRPRDEGETIGDAIFFGDDLMFGLIAERSRTRTPWPEYLRQRLVSHAGLRLVMGGLPGRTSRWDDEIYAKASGEWARPCDFNGLYHFGTLFSSHSPLWVIIALGTNDLKANIREEALRVMSKDSAFTFRLDLSPQELKLTENDEKGEEIATDSDRTEGSNPDDASLVIDADVVARSVGSLALKARRLFKGHCHEGNLRILVLVPPTVHLTRYTRRQGFDQESVRLSKMLPEAFEKMSKEWNVRIVSIKGLDNHEWPDGLTPPGEAAMNIAEQVWDAMKEELPRKSKRISTFDS